MNAATQLLMITVFMLILNPSPIWAQVAPRTTTTEVNGVEDAGGIVVALNGTDPVGEDGDLIATVRRLPNLGALTQFDGTPIDSAPAVVTDSQRRVVFTPQPNGFGNPYDTIQYSVENPVDSRRSSWGRVDINVTNVPDRQTVSVYHPYGSSVRHGSCCLSARLRLFVNMAIIWFDARIGWRQPRESLEIRA